LFTKVIVVDYTIGKIVTPNSVFTAFSFSKNAAGGLPASGGNVRASAGLPQAINMV